MTKRQEIAIRALASAIVNFIIVPLILICGINWLLEAGGHSLLPYSLSSWIGAVFVTTAFKARIAEK